MTALTNKGFGCIYTDPEHIKDVESILREIDKWEYDGYYPDGGLVASWDAYPTVKYTGKFDLREDEFKKICKDRNIPIFIFDAGKNPYPAGYYPHRPMNREEIKTLSYYELQVNN